MSVLGAASRSPHLSDAWKMLVVKYACCGTFSFTFYETCLTLADEERWIWKMPKSSLTRWLYFFSKYFALGAQITNTITTFVLHNQYPLLHETCRQWFIYRITAAQIMLICIELILMLRLHRLYNHNSAVTWFLRSLLLGEIGLMGVAVFILQRRLEFSNACLITQTPRIVAYFGSGGLVTHVCILILTIFPAIMDKGWRKVPILTYMIRDGMAEFLVISSLLLITMLYDTFRQEVASVVFSSFISIVSSVGCRLIINLCSKGVKHRQESDTGFQLSTSLFDPL